MRRWDKMVKKAEKDLRKSSAQIQESVRGVRSERPKTWRLGSGPGSVRQWR